MKFSLSSSFSPWRKKVVLWTGVLFLAYTLVGFFILPKVARALAVTQLSKQLDRPVAVEKVTLNPYTFCVSLRGLLIKDKDGEPLLSWDRVDVNFQLASLFRRAWIFKDVNISQPFARVQLNQDYTLNFSDIVAKFKTAPPKPAEFRKSRAWRITRLRLIGAKASFTDLTKPLPFRRTIGPFEMTLSDFKTDPDNKNPYAFSGTTDGGERFSWKGFFYLDPLRSEGEFSLDALSLTKYAPLYQHWLPIEIKDGVINLHSTYRYKRSPATNFLVLTNTTLALSSLKVVEKGIDQPLVDVASLVINGASMDLMARKAEVEGINVAGARGVLRRKKEDAPVQATELSTPPEAATNAPAAIPRLLGEVADAAAVLLSTAKFSSGTLRELNVTNSALLWEDLMNSPPVRLDLDGIVVTARNISNRPGTNMTAKVEVRWETNGTFRAEIEAGLSPPTAEVRLTLEQLDLRPLAAYLDPYLDVVVLGSNLGLDGTVSLRSPKDGAPAIRFEGDVSLDDLSIAESMRTEGLLKCRALRISGVEANLNPPVVSVAEVRLEDLSTEVIIETNRMLNLTRAFRREGATNTPAQGAGTNAAAAALPAKVSLRSLVLSNASVHFVDRSLRPNVNFTIGQLSGTVSGLSSDDSDRAIVNLRGSVDKTSAAEITGRINPWNQKQPTELKIDLKDINLRPADPYSGKYLGYQLTKGQLTAALSYRLAERKLTSRNQIQVNRLTLGQRVSSPDATKLPVRLAIAILKDRNGQIELDVPIDGSLDDPEFHFGQVISRAMGNLFTKIVTSPFAALKGLFGGKGEELSFQEFQPGSTNLLSTNLEKLNALVKGLYERPELQLEIEGSADPKSDLDALRREKLRKEFCLQKWKSLPVAEQERLSPDQVELTPEEYRVYVREAYAKALLPETIGEGLSQPNLTNRAPGEITGAKRGPPQSQAASRPGKTRAPQKGAAGLMKPAATSSNIESKAATIDNRARHSPSKNLDLETGRAAVKMVPPLDAATELQIEGRVLDRVEITPMDLETLAGDRARMVKEYILQTRRLEPERIGLAQSPQDSSPKGSRVYLRLQ